MERNALPWYLFLAVVFVAGLITANVISSKLITIGGIFVPAGVLAYSVTFAMTDTICELWGRERTQIVVNSGFAVQVLVWLLVMLAVVWPPAPFWDAQAAFGQIFGATGRIIVASLCAYLVSQTLDVFLFNWIKQRTRTRWLWLRNNASTFASQLVDTVVFITIAFAGVTDLLPLIVGQLIVKWAIAVLDTPVVYALVYLLRRRLGTRTTAEGVAAA